MPTEGARIWLSWGGGCCWRSKYLFLRQSGTDSAGCRHVDEAAAAGVKKDSEEKKES